MALLVPFKASMASSVQQQALVKLPAVLHLAVQQQPRHIATLEASTTTVLLLLSAMQAHQTLQWLN